MGRHTDKNIPEDGEWAKMTPKEKAEWFDSNYSAHKIQKKSQIYKNKHKKEKG